MWPFAWSRTAERNGSSRPATWGADHVGVGDVGHEFRDAGAARREADPAAAGQSAEDVGNKCGTLLVPGHDEFDRAAQKSVQNIDGLLAR